MNNTRNCGHVLMLAMQIFRALRHLRTSMAYIYSNTVYCHMLGILKFLSSLACSLKLSKWVVPSQALMSSKAVSSTDRSGACPLPSPCIAL